MLILDEFIVLNFPKTGSTFVRKVIKKIHRNRKKKIFNSLFYFRKGIKRSLYLQEILCPSNFNPSVNTQHGGYFQIPKQFLDREILATIRHPYHRLLSMYSYNWWKDKYPLSKEFTKIKFPTFPNLSLPEFIQYWELVDTKRYPAIKDVNNIGFQSNRFISMFFPNPEEIIKKLTSGYLSFDEVYQLIPKITFIKQEDLTTELIYFLLKKGYSQNEVKQIKNTARLNMSVNTNISSADKNQALSYLLKKEKFLIGMYNNLGFNYSFEDL